MTPVLVPNDAIGNDVRGMAKCLQKSGYSVEIYAESVHPLLAADAGTLSDARQATRWSDPATLVVYHHSMAWPAGLAILRERRGPLAVKYHNVTPPEFFMGYSQEHVNACEAGERATSELATNSDAVFWADSAFNADDLVRRGARSETCRVLPPFHLVESMANMPPDPATVNRFRSCTGTKLLFVGGIKPNKGHRSLIRVLARFRHRYDPDAVLLLAGSSDARLSGYTETVTAYARDLGVDDAVIFTGSVTASALRSLYLLADVFLCLSDHEGFCVPLIEAMYFRTPIVASEWSAVAETVSDAGLMCTHGDVNGIARSIDRCTSVSAVAADLTRNGWRRFHDIFATRIIEAQLLGLIDEAFSV